MSNAVLRDHRGRLLPGSASPNPRGRPKTGLALAEAIREVVEEPAVLRDLVRTFVELALGRPVVIDLDWLREREACRARGEPDPPRRGEAIQPTIPDMQRAAEWLASWGFRKPPQEVEYSGEPAFSFDYGRLSDAELAELEQLHHKASGVLDVPGGPPDATSSR